MSLTEVLLLGILLVNVAGVTISVMGPLTKRQGTITPIPKMSARVPDAGPPKIRRHAQDYPERHME